MNFPSLPFSSLLFSSLLFPSLPLSSLLFSSLLSIAVLCSLAVCVPLFKGLFGGRLGGAAGEVFVLSSCFFGGLLGKRGRGSEGMGFGG